MYDLIFIVLWEDILFEVTSSNLGAQDALLAGGRYDSLMGKFSAEESKSIGFAAGIERLMLAMKRKNEEEVEEEDTPTGKKKVVKYTDLLLDIKKRSST